MRGLDGDWLALPVRYLHALACSRVLLAARHRHQRRLPVPRSAPGALAPLDARGPVLAARPDAKVVGPAGREAPEDLLGLRQGHILRRSDEGQVLPDQEERLSVVEFQEPRVLLADAHIALAIGRGHLEPNRGRPHAACAVLECGNRLVRAGLPRGEPGLPHRLSRRIDPVRLPVAAGDLPPLVLLAIEGREDQRAAAGRLQLHRRVHLFGVERVMIGRGRADRQLDLLIAAHSSGGDLDCHLLGRGVRRHQTHAHHGHRAQPTKKPELRHRQCPFPRVSEHVRREQLCNTNDECRRTNDEARIKTKPLYLSSRVRPSTLGFRHSFVIRHFCFVLSCQRASTSRTRRKSISPTSRSSRPSRRKAT